ncbi:MAG TPA: methyltransferase domain-containing protein [Rhodanobacteraceae bacterium]|nr:methyltransferase domain-containing protein [Rhodanobacteraceae bacterium]
MTGTDRPGLPFTGERFTPECQREIWYEHWHRYAFARRFAQGKRVLDAACGEGYGSALLADAAADVVGLDISADAIAHARARYAAQPRLRFECGDAAALGFPDRSFDLVVSFETLEHLAAQTELVAGFARVLTDEGLLLISSPDRKAYSEVAGYQNPFHVRELYRDELLALLRPHFPDIRLYGQKLLFQSVLWALDGSGQGSESWTANRDGSVVEAGLAYAPLYFVALCGKVPGSGRSVAPALSVFGDRDETVYAHYNHEIRQNMQAGARIAQLESALRDRRNPAEAPSSPAREPDRRRWWRWWRHD